MKEGDNKEGGKDKEGCEEGKRWNMGLWSFYLFLIK
jgi:hypothetical protein